MNIAKAAAKSAAMSAAMSGSPIINTFAEVMEVQLRNLHETLTHALTSAMVHPLDALHGSPSGFELPSIEDTLAHMQGVLKSNFDTYRPRYRGPQCRWCRADDYRKSDGRCPRCGDHKDRGRTEYTMSPRWWRMDAWDRAPYLNTAASVYACGKRPSWVVMLD